MPTTTDSTDPRVARTRAAVQEAATALLFDGGVRAVTIEAIVQRSGVARSTIYRHWPTRSDVVADAMAGLLRPLPAPPASGDLAGRLSALLSPMTDMGRTRRLGMVPALLAEADRDPELAGFRERFTNAYTEPVAAVLRDAIDTGELSADTPLDEATSQLLGPLMFHRFVFTDGTVDAAFIGRMIDLFLASRGAQP
jgi:AcrR family transcriptional regulator